MRDELLRSILAGESRAYGFTISFWGSGAVLISNFGVPGVLGALMYGLGAVTGFGILALYSFGAEKEVKKTNSQYLALASVHYLASLAPILVAGLLARYLTSVPAFFVGGLSVSLLYNLLALLEEDISEVLV